MPLETVLEWLSFGCTSCQLEGVHHQWQLNKDEVIGGDGKAVVVGNARLPAGGNASQNAGSIHKAACLTI